MKIATTQVWVNDQDEALAFYTDKLGMEVRSRRDDAGDGRLPLADGEPGGPGGRRDRADGGSRRRRSWTRRRPSRSATLTAKGFAGTVFLTTEDVCADYEAMKSRGVEFVDEPEERPYGIDCGFRDPSGNHFRLTQLTEF